MNARSRECVCTRIRGRTLLFVCWICYTCGSGVAVLRWSIGINFGSISTSHIATCSLESSRRRYASSTIDIHNLISIAKAESSAIMIYEMSASYYRFQAFVFHKIMCSPSWFSRYLVVLWMFSLTQSNRKCRGYHPVVCLLYSCHRLAHKSCSQERNFCGTEPALRGNRQKSDWSSVRCPNIMLASPPRFPFFYAPKFSWRRSFICEKRARFTGANSFEQSRLIWTRGRFNSQLITGRVITLRRDKSEQSISCSVKANLCLFEGWLQSRYWALHR